MHPPKTKTTVSRVAEIERGARRLEVTLAGGKLRVCGKVLGLARACYRADDALMLAAPGVPLTLDNAELSLLLELLVGSPEFLPKEMREAEAVFFMEAGPEKHACGQRLVRGLSCATGKPQLVTRLCGAFGPQDRIAVDPS